MSDGQGRLLLNKLKLMVLFFYISHFVEGNMLSTMAKAVEDSDVILMCISESYRDSQSCRSGMYKRWVVNRGGQQSVSIFVASFSPFILQPLPLSSRLLHTLLILYK